MPSTRVEVSLNEELTAALDEARGFEPRASFVKRALEKALSTEGGSPRGPVGAEPATRASARGSSSASSRAPVEKEPATEPSFAEVPGVSSGRLPASSRPAHNANFNRAGKLR